VIAGIQTPAVATRSRDTQSGPAIPLDAIKVKAAKIPKGAEKYFQ